MPKIPFSPPRIDEAIVQEVADALRSGWITTGPRTKALEKEVARISQVDNVLCVSSWTTGMELILRWWGIGPGDEVIIPAYTYCASANVVIHCGAKPVMVDINPGDFNISIDKVREAITGRTKVIMPVDIGGMPVDYDALNQLVREPQVQQLFNPGNDYQKQLGRIAIFSDAAHSFGALYNGKPVAKQTDIAVYSFHAVKNLTTAEGGAICLNLPEGFDAEAIYKALNTLSLHGQSKDALAKYGKNSWEYDVAYAGYKCNMPDVLAAIGLVEVRRYEQDHLIRRRAIFDRYIAAFQNKPWAELPSFETEKKRSSYHLFLLRIKNATLDQRNAIIQRIYESDVSVNVHYKPLPLLSFYKGLGYKMEDYPVAKDCWERVITLPVFYDLTEEIQAQVVRAVEMAVEGELGQVVPHL